MSQSDSAAPNLIQECSCRGLKLGVLLPSGEWHSSASLAAEIYRQWPSSRYAPRVAYLLVLGRSWAVFAACLGTGTLSWFHGVSLKGPKLVDGLELCSVRANISPPRIWNRTEHGGTSFFFFAGCTMARCGLHRVP